MRIAIGANGSAADAGPARFPTLAILTIAAILLRLPQIGNPLYDVDEQFYLLVGDRLLHGALPYVDIWDRKPIGLFLIYAAIRLLGDGVVPYQIVATLVAIATATVIAAIARRMTGAVGAAGAGLVYLTWLTLLGGGGGQSPVFYNLLTALAALATVGALDPADAARRHRRGYFAMLAMGVAIQIKPTVVPEGCLFGGVIIWLAWREYGREHGRIPAVALLAARLILVALAPTIAAFVWYGVAGHASALWLATVTSIFLRTTPPHVEPMTKLIGIGWILLPLAAAGLVGVALRWRRGAAAPRFAALWLTVAVAAFLAVPPYHNHYALPVLVPLSVATALAFERGPLWRIALALAAAALLTLLGFPDFGRARVARARVAALDDLIARHLGDGCLFVFEGPTIVYRAARACSGSRYLFPNHLNTLGEAGAIGADPATEIAHVLAGHPSVILAADRRTFPDPNPATWPIVEAALATDYVPTGTVTVDFERIAVYARKR